MEAFVPGPLELIVIMVAVIALIAQVLLIRFVFRINKQIKLLTEIRDQLILINNTEGEEK